MLQPTSPAMNTPSQDTAILFHPLCEPPISPCPTLSTHAELVEVTSRSWKSHDGFADIG